MSYSGYDRINITGAGLNLVKTGSGILIAVIVNSSVANSVILCYDNINLVEPNVPIAFIANPAVLTRNQYYLPLGAHFERGLLIQGSDADDVTVIYH